MMTEGDSFSEAVREAYHTHAFNAWTWFLKGELVEEDVSGELYNYERSLLPKTTLKGKNHRVKADTNSWCFTLRGPWVDRWTEYNESEDETSVFTHGRRVIERLQGIQLGGESCQQSK